MNTSVEIELFQIRMMDAIYTREEEAKVIIIHPDTYQRMLLYGSPEDNHYCFAGKVVIRSYDLEPFEFQMY